MNNILWQGTADVDGYNHPMRITEDGDGRLMTEWASDTETENAERQFDDTTWYADYQKRFRNMQPTPNDELIERMLADKLLDAR